MLETYKIASVENFYDFVTAKLSGRALYEVRKGKNVRLFESRDKFPWKKYYEILSAKAKGLLSIVPLKKDLCPLTIFTDFVLLARGQKPNEVIKLLLYRCKTSKLIGSFYPLTMFLK